MRSWCVLCSLLLAVSCPAELAAWTIENVVSLGDSLMDDPDGERSPVSAEHIAERLGVPLTKFAKSGSTSRDLIRDGQHTRTTAAFGENDLAILWIGGNDFFRRTFRVTLGLYGFIDDLEANVDAALRELRAEDENIKVVVFNLPDLSNIPLTDSISNFRKATERWNARLEVLADRHGAAVVDVFSLFDQLATAPNDFALLGNTPILESPPLFGGDCPLCVFADLVHPSAFAQGYITNEAIEVINQTYGQSLEELTRVEIALLAGLRPGDFDNNQWVDAADLDRWQSSFGNTGADADSDADTDGNDFLVWQQRNDSAGFAATEVVPEPTLLAYVMTAAFVFSSTFSRAKRPALR